MCIRDRADIKQQNINSDSNSQGSRNDAKKVVCITPNTDNGEPNAFLYFYRRHQESQLSKLSEEEECDAEKKQCINDIVNMCSAIVAKEDLQFDMSLVLGNLISYWCPIESFLRKQVIGDLCSMVSGDKTKKTMLNIFFDTISKLNKGNMEEAKGNYDKLKQLVRAKQLTDNSSEVTSSSNITPQ